MSRRWGGDNAWTRRGRGGSGGSSHASCRRKKRKKTKKDEATNKKKQKQKQRRTRALHSIVTSHLQESEALFPDFRLELTREPHVARLDRSATRLATTKHPQRARKKDVSALYPFSTFSPKSMTC